jgi:hypothetical protein
VSALFPEPAAIQVLAEMILFERDALDVFLAQIGPDPASENAFFKALLSNPHAGSAGFGLLDAVLSYRVGTLKWVPTMHFIVDRLELMAIGDSHISEPGEIL